MPQRVVSKIFYNDQMPDDNDVNAFLDQWPDAVLFKMERSVKKVNQFLVVITMAKEAYDKRLAEIEKAKIAAAQAEKERQAREAALAVEAELAQVRARAETLASQLPKKGNK